MDDFNGLAASLASGVGDVRGCLILSRDGLVLGAYPEEGEAAAKPAWLRLASLGDIERGFAQYGAEVWCYVRRGPYAAFVLAGPGTRPGLVIDQIEQVLLAAEESRNKREGIRPAEAPAGPSAPSSKPRAPLHPESHPADEPTVIHAETSASTAAQGAPPAAVDQPTSAAGPAEPGLDPAGTAAPDGSDGLPPRSGNAAPGGMWATGEDDEEDGDVDRFSIAREFSQLLQDEQDSADG